MTPLPSPRGPRRLGATAVEVGPIAYGCWRLAEGDADAARAKIAMALDLGMTLVDTADIYGFDGTAGFGRAEELLGEVLAAEPDMRDRMVLATKGGIDPGIPYDSSVDYLRRAVDASLRRLCVDQIDLYQIHRHDLLVRPADVAALFAELRAAGKVRWFGLSNVTASQIDLKASGLDEPLVTQQPKFSALDLEPCTDGVFDRCQRDNMTPLAWSPMAGGALGDGVDPGDDASARVLAVLDRLASNSGVRRSSVALAFVLAHPSQPIPIIGTQNLDRVRAATEALEIELTRAEWYEIYQASTGVPLP